MSPVLRKVLSWLCAALVLVAATAWLTLSLGRPFYYTDGERLVSAFELQNASMLALGRPEPVLEIPGPVRGRIARLPDGRLLYGRAIGETDTDLVLWDPRRKDLAPEPVAGLRTRFHELAPFLASDGTLWFASDREGGLGGFDLWRTTWRDGRPGVVEHLPDGINTAFDEIDPALDQTAQTLVFARRDDGKDARLFTAWLANPGQCAPLFSDALDPRRNGEAKGRAVLDREPCFTPEGASLWFVREVQGEAPRLLRTARLQKEWSEPIPTELGPEFHAPLTNERELWVLGKPPASEGSPVLLYRVRQEEVLPWRAGQRTLEIVLLSLFFAALLALVLLQLGKRFTKLDTITICLLASLFVHVVLLLWLGRMEILARHAPHADGGGGQLEVTVLSALEGEARALLDGTGATAGSGLVSDTAMERHQGQIETVAPSSALGGESAPAVARSVELGAIEATSASVSASDVRDAAALADAARKAGTAGDRLVQVAPGDAPAAPVAAAGIAARRAVAELGAHAVEVAVPSTEPGALIERGAAPRAGTHVDPATEDLPSTGAGPAPGTVALRDVAPASASAAKAGIAGDRTEVAPERLAASSASAVAKAVLETPKARPSGAARGAQALVVPGSDLVAPQERSARPEAHADLDAGPALRSPLAVVRDAVVGPGPERGAAAKQGSTSLARPEPAIAALPEPQATPSRSGLAPSRAAGPGRKVGGEALSVPTSDLLGALAPRATPADAGEAVGAAARPLAPSAVVRDLAHAEPASKVPTRRGPAAGAAGASVVPAPWQAQERSRGAGTALRPDRGSLVADLGTLATPRPPSSFLEAAPLALRAELASSEDLSPYQNRFGPKRAQALERFGGTAETEAAVQRGLRYLAKIQQEDGGFGQRRRDDPKYGDTRIGKTGLCLLAFLGAGHTQAADSTHADVVAHSIAFLLEAQDERTGHFGHGSAYDHGICTYALAECYGLTKDARLKQPLEKALAWIAQKQNRTRDPRNEGGWGYFSPVLQPEDRFSRSSISAWMVMALESAKLAGFEIDGKVLERAREFLLRSFDAERGFFLYNKEPGRLASEWPTLPASTPASVFALFLLGVGGDDYRMRAGLEFTIDRKPSQYRKADSEDFVRRAQSHVYFWYYGSLACFLAGGNLWADWNEALKRILLPAQSKDGSFAPIDIYAEYAGDTNKDRAYTTAMCVLCLEVYYRYFTPLLRSR